MNIYEITLYAIQTITIVLLLIIPLIYSIYKGNIKKVFLLTWIIWSIVFFIYGIFIPTFARLVEKATGEYPDVTCATIIIGILIGWFPALIISYLGKTIHNILHKKI